MKKYIFLLAFIFLLGLNIHAQSVYHFKYHLQKEIDSTGYDALLVSDDLGTGTVRIKFNLPGGQPMLVDMLVQEDYPDKSNGMTGDGRLFYRLSFPRFIRGKETKFTTPVFWFKKDSTTSLFEPWGVTATLSDPQATINTFEKAELLPNKELQKNFVLDYYDANESFYQNLFVTKTRALTQQEKNTKLILLVVANIRDTTIGEACRKDMNRAKETFGRLTSMLGIRMDTVTISGDNYNKANVAKAIDAIKPSPNDIVVFYYSGHGFRQQKDSRRFPYLDLRPKNDRTLMVNTMNVEDIMALIRKKGARLNLVITDCCNTQLDSPNAFGTPIPRKKVLGLELFQDNVRTLFFNPAPTSIIATAADVDQKASCNNDFGGFFSYFFIQSMQEQLGYLKKNVSWNDVLLGAQAQTDRKAKRTYCEEPEIPANICDQQPYYKIITGR